LLGLKNKAKIKISPALLQLAT